MEWGGGGEGRTCTPESPLGELRRRALGSPLISLWLGCCGLEMPGAPWLVPEAPWLAQGFRWEKALRQRGVSHSHLLPPHPEPQGVGAPRRSHSPPTSLSAWCWDPPWSLNGGPTGIVSASPRTWFLVPPTARAAAGSASGTQCGAQEDGAASGNRSSLCTGPAGSKPHPLSLHMHDAQHLCRGRSCLGISNSWQADCTRSRACSWQPGWGGGGRGALLSKHLLVPFPKRPDETSEGDLSLQDSGNTKRFLFPFYINAHT